MKKVLVLFGGASSEYEISLLSSYSVITNIPRDKYDVITLGITRDGEWFLYEGDYESIRDDRWREGKCTPAVLSPDISHHGILVFDENGARPMKVDVVFPVLHGKNGEDGTIRGLLELARVPFVGCDCTSSAVTMDKALTNAVCDIYGIAQAKWTSINEIDYRKNGDELLTSAVEKLGYPIFVKPANAGSSVGISKVKNMDELKAAMELGFENDPKVVLEEGIVGMEVESAVLGNDDDIFVSTVGEVVPCNEFYDYEAKYLANESELHIPARLSEEKINEVRAAAERAFRVFGCSGLSRIDFFVRESDGAVMLNEPNTMPGFTPISMYPKLCAASGIEYGDLLDRLIKLAVEKWEK